MEFQFEPIETLPRLAWCARIKREEDRVVVRHGPWVETRPTFFCEGAWNGEFAEGRPDLATVFMGSAGVLQDDQILFASPTHCLEKLFVLRNADEVLVSNSLAFVLAEAGDGCDPTYPNYVYDLLDFNAKGLHCHHSTLPTARGEKAHLYKRCNLLVTRGLGVEIVTKPPGSAPQGYDHYLETLRICVKDTTDNALSSLRKRTYSPVATVSSGYDSTACAVLAREVGCKKAVTLPTANLSRGDSHDDSGSRAAGALGLLVTERDWHAFEHKDGFPEAEFCACGNGQDINLLAMEDEFSGRMVFTGCRGDYVWERLGYEFPWWSMTSYGVTEFRLRVGYIHMCAASIGEVFSRAIHEISQLDEMRIWSICEDYDRPIPRRIAEEAGVPRSYFGQIKKGTAHLPLWMIDRLTEKSRIDFLRFASSAYVETTRIERAEFRLGRILLRLNERCNRVIVSVAESFGRRVKPRIFLSSRYQRRHNPGDLAFNWGQQKMVDRYAEDPKIKSPS